MAWELTPFIRNLTSYQRPLSRALRRLENDFYILPVQTRRNPWYNDNYHGFNRQLVDAFQRVGDFADEMEALSHELNAPKRDPVGELALQRSQDGSLQLAMDVSGYKPEDIKINLLGDHLSIEAKCEEKGENSYSKSEVKRWFKLPQDCKVEEIKSNLTKDNKLMISIPSSKPAVDSKSRSIPINIDKREAVEGSKQSEGSSNDAKQAAKN